MQKNEREIWIDAVKIFACVLVAAGHFFQSMVSSGIIAENALYGWFNQGIYAFHVPLFFVCSGYLYQKHSRVNSIGSWSKNVIKKALALGVPYLVFSVITWTLKVLFAGEVNNQAQGLLRTLFLEPLSPYWYLYCLFILFVITPTLWGKRGSGIALFCTLLMKLLVCFMDVESYMLSNVLQNAIWFVLGMCLCSLNWIRFLQGRYSFMWGMAASVIFIIYGIIRNETWAAMENFILGLLACFGCLSIIICAVRMNDCMKRIAMFFARYTMPVFLMHTIFAASLRSVLLKLGVDGAGVHIISGLLISFAGPMIAQEVMHRIKYLDFVFYTGKYIRIK